MELLKFTFYDYDYDASELIRRKHLKKQFQNFNSKRSDIVESIVA